VSRKSLLLLLALGGLGCKVQVPTITEPFADEFERAEVGAAWNNTGAEYRVVGGKLNVSNARNHPLWLRRKLPDNVVVELDVVSKSADGDLKIELFGDGESFDTAGNQYPATGYMFVFGGWHNMLSVIGRLGEHDEAVKAKRTEPKVQPDRTYHWTITKRGGQIDWKIDGQPFLSFTDPQPLSGPRNAYFAINNWEADVYFDNLRIQPAP
jgi:hypothetical protein